MTGPDGKKERMRRCALRSRAGVTYVTLLTILVIMGISMTAAGKYWANISLRDKEEELLFRGDQYRTAIEHYYTAIPGKPQYPASIDDLLVDNRTAMGKRHLRQKYKDPITNEDFVEIRDQATKRIIGVRSASDKAPLKKDDFPEVYKDFIGKEKYSEWQFLFVLQQAPHGQPGQQPPQPQPRPPQ